MTYDPSAMVAAIQEALPGLGELQRIGDGFNAVVFRSAGGHVIRIAKTPRAAARHALLLAVLSRLAPSLPCPIPIPDAIVPASPALPHGALTYSWLSGVAATPDLLTGSIADQIAEALVALRAVDPTRFPEIDHDTDDRWVALRAVVEPACHARLDPAEAGTLEVWWERFLAAPERRRFRPAVCHGDLWHENLLLDPTGNRLCGILDWDNIVIGDPAQDLAYLRHASDAVTDAVFAEYVTRSGADAASMAQRVRWFWEVREFDGLRLAIEQHDEVEMVDAIGKLRRGPILAPEQASTS
jgi:aminoglycoside phosphotransferase (APT) family kinase protein